MSRWEWDPVPAPDQTKDARRNGMKEEALSGYIIISVLNYHG